jgi:AcrR family transcriptional regulator
VDTYSHRNAPFAVRIKAVSESINVVNIDGKDRRPWAVASRELLLRAAIAEIAERGYEHARLVDIAARADMTVGAIYNWFENKSMLFGAALEFALKEQQATNKNYLTRDNVHAATGFQANHWVMLIAALAPRQGADSAPTDAQRILLEALRCAWRDDDLNNAVRSEVSELLAQYESIVEQAMLDGFIDRSLDAKLIARVFLAFPVGLSSLTLAGAPDLDPKAFIALFSRFNEALAPKTEA